VSPYFIRAIIDNYSSKSVFQDVNVVEDFEIPKRIVKLCEEFMYKHLLEGDMRSDFASNPVYALQLSDDVLSLYKAIYPIITDLPLLFWRSNADYEFGGPSGLLSSHRFISPFVDVKVANADAFLINVFDFLLRKNMGMFPDEIDYHPMAHPFIYPTSSGTILSSVINDTQNRTIIESTLGQGDAISKGNNSIYVEMRDGNPIVVRKTFSGQSPKELVLPGIGTLSTKKSRAYIRKHWLNNTCLVNGVRSPHNVETLTKLEEVAKTIENELGFPIKIEYYVDGDKLYLTQLDPMNKVYDPEKKIEFTHSSFLRRSQPFVNKPFHIQGRLYKCQGDLLTEEEQYYFEDLQEPFIVFTGPNEYVNRILVERLQKNPYFQGLLSDNAVSFATHHLELSTMMHAGFHSEMFLQDSAVMGAPGINEKLSFKKAKGKNASRLLVTPYKIEMVSNGLRGMIYRV